jgi:MFS family permease
MAVLVLLFFVRDVPRTARPRGPDAKGLDLRRPMGARFWKVLGVIFLFTLGNSTDAFLLLRANQLGVPVALAPILWAALHVVKTASNVPGGVLSDRVGRRPTLIAGWLLYALVYFGFARAGTAWQAWALFAGYGLYFGLTEGSERALVADMVSLESRGTAYGWYNLAIGLGALPASLLFGFVWDRAGAPVAFLMGASLAVAAAAAMTLVGKGK